MVKILKSSFLATIPAMILVIIAIGLNAYSNPALANLVKIPTPDSLNDNSSSNLASPTTAKIQYPKPNYKFLVQTSIFVSQSQLPRPLVASPNYLNNTIVIGAQLRAGYSIWQKLDYSFSPDVFSNNYLTVGFSAKKYYITNDNHFTVNDWDAKTLTIGDMVEFSHANFSFVKLYLMPLELGFNQNNYTYSYILYTPKNTTIRKVMSNQTYSKKFSLDANIGLGITVFQMMALLKAGYNFQQHASSVTLEIGFGL